MKVIYHEDFKKHGYANNPAASEGRIGSILQELKKNENYEFIEPQPATVDDLKLVHTESHINRIKKRGNLLYSLALLSVGGAIKAANIAYSGEPSFALIRPPGHHASPDSAWGFCYFNNMAVAIEKLRKENKIRTAYILDFDLHTGDGNINSLKNKKEIKIFNPTSKDREDYLEEIFENFDKASERDMIGVSAGFDEHIEDWGGKLTTQDYKDIGQMVRNFSKEKCNGRRFALLEGGYNLKVLGKNVASFLEGFREE